MVSVLCDVAPAMNLDDISSNKTCQYKYLHLAFNHHMLQTIINMSYARANEKSETLVKLSVLL